MSYDDVIVRPWDSQIAEHRGCITAELRLKGYRTVAEAQELINNTASDDELLFAHRLMRMGEAYIAAANQLDAFAERHVRVPPSDDP